MTPASNAAMFDPVRWWAQVDGSRRALVDAKDGESHSYSRLDRDADRWCAALQALGVQSEDRVAVLAHNRVEHIALFYGCARAGAILVPLNWRLSVPELARVLSDAAPAVLLVESRTKALADAAMQACEGSAFHGSVRTIDLDRPQLLSAQGAAAAAGATGAERNAADRASVAAEDIAMLLYTSGSSGTPKGVTISHRQILFNAIATTTAWRLGADDVGPATTPFFHTGGWHVFTTPLLFRGGTVVVCDAFEPASHLRMLARHGVSVAFGVPAQLAMLRETPEWGMPLPRMRWFIAGGAPCPPAIKASVREAGYRLREGYGLTECGPNCFATTDETALERDGAVGWPVPFLEMRLRADSGALAATGETGELELRGPQLFSGYFRASQATTDAFTDDGWFRTGDLASRDDAGVFRIRGRRKEMFISGGENVYPGEVEAALLDCPGVREVAVVGVPHPTWGEVGCAIVVPAASPADTALDAGTLFAFARTCLAGYKVPKEVRFVDALPRLGSGKLDRRAVEDMIRTTR